MNRKPKHKFTKGNQPPNINKQKPKRKTLAKEAILRKYVEKRRFKEIDDAKIPVLDAFAEALFEGSKAEQLIAAKELAKYLFPTKQNITGNMEGKINIVFENIKNE